MKTHLDRRSAVWGLILWCVVVWAAAGCTIQQLTMGSMLEPADIALDAESIHFSKVLEQLGPPHKMSDLPGGFVFLYEYYAPQGWQAGGRLPFQEADFLSWLRADLGAGFARRQALVLLFDDTGMLTQKQHLRDEREDSGAGVKLSFLLGSGNLIDTVDVDRTVGPHQWGASLLMPLDKALNRAQNLETGQCGVEQFGTSTKVGQHTLEFD